MPERLSLAFSFHRSSAWLLQFNLSTLRPASGCQLNVEECGCMMKTCFGLNLDRLYFLRWANLNIQESTLQVCRTVQWAYLLLTFLPLNQEPHGDVRRGCRDIEDPWGTSSRCSARRGTGFLLLTCRPHAHGSKGSWSPLQATPLSSRDGHLSTAHTRSPVLQMCKRTNTPTSQAPT